MKKLLLSAIFATGLVAAIEAAPTDTVTQADLKALIERIAKLEAENKAQAAKIAELQGSVKAVSSVPSAATAGINPDEGTTVSESGKVYTTKQGFKYYLADKGAKIFEPLSESGLKITPYGWLVFEGVYSTRALDCDWSADFVKNKNKGNNRDSTSTLSMQDSILGLQFVTPEKVNGWTFSGKAEFDLAGGDANSYDFHWRHLYVDAAHESGWSVLFGQTWHLWKMVTPNEIDGAWLENAGHPYRRSPQVRVTKKWDFEKSSLEWRAGIVKNGPGMGGDRDKDKIEDNSASPMPLFETAFLYDRDAAWEDVDSGKRWLLGIGGMYGQDRSHRWSGGYDADGNKICNGEGDQYNSMMIMVAGKVPYRSFTLTGQFFAGENLGGVQAGCAQRVGYSEIDQKGTEVRTVGGFLDLAYDINDRWSTAIGYGFDNPNDSDAKLADGVLYNDRAYVAAFYKILDNFKLGLEYAYLNTKYAEDGEAAANTSSANRFQFSAYYDF